MSQPLEDYDAKRDFESTPEPPGAAHESETGRLFVVHKHAATRLHYDLRLENDGVLMSWAVPKGPSFDTKQRRLAVHVEDHPVDYGSFEGTIPESEYGGGTVMLWDRGTWNPHGDVAESMADGKLVFDLDGTKLTGRFGLIHTGARKGGREQNQWLLIKEKDEYVRSADEYDVTEAEPRSVATERTMDEIAAGEAEDDPEEPDPANVPGATSREMPADPRPQLAKAAARPPSSTGWLHEIKHDGYRLLLSVQDGEARALTREGHDWSERFAGLVSAAAALPLDSAILDCEAVALGPSGTSDFGALQSALSEARSDDVVAYCFDLIHLDGYDLSDVRLAARKELLQRLLGPASATARLRYADHVVGDASDVLAAACELGVEGIISKRADAPYRPGRSGAWVKSKCVRRQEFVVVGYRHARSGGLGALLLGYYDGDTLAYAGRVGSGFSERISGELLERLRELEVDEPSLSAPPDTPDDVRWVDPRTVVEVAFAEWSAKGLLRHAAFKGIREDRDPATITREDAPSPVTPALAADGAPQVLGVRITHPDRVMVEGGMTKLELARYYAAAAPAVLAHLGGRPLTLLRCPDGAADPCFWQRHIDEGTVPHVHSFDALDREYVTLESEEALVELVQYLTVEFHVWGSRAYAPDRPDRLVFDLDPGEGIEWDDMRAAALLVREVLSAHGLESFVKTSGGKGLHVVTPIVPKVPVVQAAAATKVLASEAVAASGDVLTIDPRKSSRSGRIFCDWHRNGAGQSTVAAYVVRARRGGPISTPITWDELRTDVDPLAFTADAVLDRLGALGDPWELIGSVEQHLPQEALDV